MKKLIKFITLLILLLGLIAIILVFTGNSYLLKAVANTYLVGKTGPDIDEYAIFNNRTVEAGNWQRWPISSHYNKTALNSKEDSIHEKYKSVAFLVIQNDSILFEKYWENYNKDSKSNTFSAVKSFVGIMIGAAIKDGYIKSVNQKVGDFIPEYAKGKKASISIKNLLQMSSGVNFGESYGDPFGFMAKTYYGDEIYHITLNKKVKYPAGEQWKYQGGNTLMLSFIIEKATGKTLSQYFSEKVWKPIGAKNNALWNLDKKGGLEKAYCCFYSNARDFARIGKLYMNHGIWNNDTIVSYEYWKQSLTPCMIPDKNGKPTDNYGYQWWMMNYKNQQIYYARGILGQYIVFIPEKKLIFVRLGHRRSKNKIDNVPIDLYEYIDMANRQLLYR